MSTTGKTSKIILLLMIVVSIVFLVSSFLTATIRNGTPAQQTSELTGEVSAGPNDCVVVRIGSGWIGNCIF